MTMDFDEIIDRRHTNAENTDGFRGYLFRDRPGLELPWRDEDLIRMWVADMEFGVAPVILDAIRARLDRRILGYTGIYDDRYFDAFRAWCRRHYDWELPREQICLSPGVVPALFLLTGLICEPEDAVLINTPAYCQFRRAAEYAERTLLCSPLTRSETGEFVVDYADFETRCADPRCKLVIWCNPHNPTGRVWRESELRRVAEIVERYDLWVISDEIHCDLLRQGQRHIPLGKVMPDYPKLITCMAPSKTFNLAGLGMSNVIIRDEALRKRYGSRDGIFGSVNPLSLAGVEAAYEQGEAWLEELRVYLDGNFRLLADFLAAELPEAEMYPAQATYLAWVRLGDCLPDVKDLCFFFAEKAGVLLEAGDGLFVGNARGYVRLNLAMPRALLQQGLERIRNAIRAHRAQTQNA